jgi:HSP20 family molecular chaperone IbpA
MVELPEEIKANAAQANMRNGVIEIVLPKKAPRRKKKVEIE